MNDFLIQLIATFVVAIVGFRLKSLTMSGAIATVLVGLFVSIGFSYRGLLLLGLFFGSSSLWSKYKKEKKNNLQNKVEKGEQRDFVQVFANGGVAAIASVLYAFTHADIWLYLFIGSIAAANADTWASEIGTLSKKQPILLSRFQRVEAGTSGAVSVLGTIAGLMGAVLISLVSYLVWSEITLLLFLVLSIIGFLGNIIDTLLGASVQVVYKCSVCAIETEKTVHCSKNTSYYSGLRYCNNDVVNFLSILLASGVGTFFLSI